MAMNKTTYLFWDVRMVHGNENRDLVAPDNNKREYVFKQSKTISVVTWVCEKRDAMRSEPRLIAYS